MTCGEFGGVTQCRAASPPIPLKILAGFQGVRPNHTLFGFTKSNVLDLACLVTRCIEPTGRGRRLPGIDLEYHMAGDSTAWSILCAAHFNAARMSARTRYG